MLKPIITCRNPAFRAWLQAKGIEGDVNEQARPDDLLHRHAYGILPNWLACYADRVSEISMPRLSREDRDRFNRGLLSVPEMDAAGAHLVTYQIRLL